MDKEIAGQPLWIWLVGAGVVVLGYIYLTRRGQSSQAQQPAGPPSKSSSTSTFRETITDMQSAPKKKGKGSGTTGAGTTGG